jgi:hypothetical protein
MTELSPAAKAVLDAYENTYIDSGLVAAIFELADQVVPENLFGPPENAAAAQREITRAELLAIATELEAR